MVAGTVGLCLLLWCVISPSSACGTYRAAGDCGPSCGLVGEGDHGRNRTGWKDYIEIDSKQIGWDGAH